MSNYDFSDDSDNEPLEKPMKKVVVDVPNVPNVPNVSTSERRDLSKGLPNDEETITVKPKKKRTIPPEQLEKMAMKRKENYLKKKEELKKLSAEEKAELKKNKPKKEVPEHVRENLRKGREALHIKKQTGNIQKLDQKIKTAKKKLIDLDQDILPPPPKHEHTPKREPIGKREYPDKVGKPKPRPAPLHAPVQVQQPRYNIRFV